MAGNSVCHGQERLRNMALATGSTSIVLVTLSVTVCQFLLPLTITYVT